MVQYFLPSQYYSTWFSFLNVCRYVCLQQLAKSLVSHQPIALAFMRWASLNLYRMKYVLCLPHTTTWKTENSEILLFIHTSHYTSSWCTVFFICQNAYSIIWMAYLLSDVQLPMGRKALGIDVTISPLWSGAILATVVKICCPYIILQYSMLSVIVPYSQYACKLSSGFSVGVPMSLLQLTWSRC